MTCERAMIFRYLPTFRVLSRTIKNTAYEAIEEVTVIWTHNSRVTLSTRVC